MERSFAIKQVLKNGTPIQCPAGRYISKTPSSAAKKAFTKCSRTMKAKKLTLEVHIQETTKNSAKKVFKYIITREFDPIEVERNGVLVTYKYSTKLKALK